MKLADQIERYRLASIEHMRECHGGDVRKGNRAFDRKTRIARRLINSGHEAALAALLDDTVWAVRLSAAAALIDRDFERSVVVIRNAARQSEDRWTKFEAENFLKYGLEEDL